MALDLVDQLKSFVDFVQIQYGDKPVAVEKSGLGATQSGFLVEHIRSIAKGQTPIAQADIGYWKISYFSDDFWDCTKTLGDLKAVIQSRGKVPACLFDYVHPAPPEVKVVDGDEGLPAGRYQVQVSGVGRDGEESLPSAPLEAVLDATGKVLIDIPRLEQGIGPFSQYRVYLDGMLALEVVADSVGNTRCEIGAVPAADALSPPSQSKVHERYFSVEDVYVVTESVRNAEGLYEGRVRLRTRLTVPTIVKVGEKVAHVSTSLAGL